VVNHELKTFNRLVAPVKVKKRGEEWSSKVFTGDGPIFGRRSTGEMMNIIGWRRSK
jgi:hypothetical protein